MIFLGLGYLYLDCWKPVGLLNGFDDKTLSMTFVVTAIPYFFSGFLTNYTWEKFGPRKTVYLILTYQMITFLMVIFSPPKSFILLLSL